MSVPETLLYIDPDPTARREVASAFNHAGLPLRTLREPAQALAGVRLLKPDALLLHAELRSELLATVLTQLAQDAAGSQVPIVLLASDVSDQRYVSALRTGVVGFLQKPFQAARHVPELRALLADLRTRSGVASANSSASELTALVEHLRRSQRSGLMVLNAHTPEEGRALFSRGVLRTAEHLGATGMEALVAMVATPRARWSFAEVGAADAEVLIDVAAVTRPSPPPELQPVTGEVLLEVGDIGLGEEEVPIGPAAHGRRPHAQTTSILFVDDDETLSRMFGILFRKHGFSVRTAADGFSGYEAATTGTFELVVTDLDMPRMDGWGMLKLLREDFRTRELPVAFLSCHDDYRESLRALDSGAAGYFSKSTRLDALA